MNTTDYSIQNTNNKSFVENFCECLRQFLITFKNQCKQVEKSENYINNQLHFYTYLIFNHEKEDMKLKILSMVNSDINLGNNSCSEELLFRQAQNAMIKIEFALDVNPKFDNMYVDEVMMDRNFNFKMFNYENNFMCYKKYMEYKNSSTYYTIDYFISEFINMNDFLESADFMKKVSCLLN
jgi:hypothetical protein